MGLPTSYFPVPSPHRPLQSKWPARSLNGLLVTPGGQNPHTALLLGLWLRSNVKPSYPEEHFDVDIFPK